MRRPALHLLFDPQGFCRKSRLTIEYLSYSFSLFRQAKKDYTAVLVAARGRGISRIAILGASDLAEIAAICALDLGITITALIDPQSDLARFVGVPVAKSFDAIDGLVDAVLVAETRATRDTIDAAIARYAPSASSPRNCSACVPRNGAEIQFDDLQLPSSMYDRLRARGDPARAAEPEAAGRSGRKICRGIKPDPGVQ